MSSLSTSNRTAVYKVVLIGDGGVGKTTLVKRLLTGAFYKAYNATLGVEVHVLRFTTNHGYICLNIWDCAGSEKFRGLGDGYYLGAQGAILMYDTTDLRTYDNISKWDVELTRVLSIRIPTVLIGAKSDVIVKHPLTFHVEGDYKISSKNDNLHKLWEPLIDLMRQLTGHKDLTILDNTELSQTAPVSTIGRAVLREGADLNAFSKAAEEAIAAKAETLATKLFAGKHAEMLADIQDLQSERDNLISLLAKAEQENVKQSDIIRCQDATIANMFTQIKELNSQDNSRLLGTVNSLQFIVSNLERTASNLKGELAAEKHDHASTKNDLTAANDTIRCSEATIANIRDQIIKGLTTDRDQRRDQVVKVMTLMGNLEQENVKQSDTIRCSEATIANMCDQIKDLKSRLAVTTDNANALQMHLRNATHDLQIEKDTLADFKTIYHRILDDLVKLKNELSDENYSNQVPTPEVVKQNEGISNPIIAKMCDQIKGLKSQLAAVTTTTNNSVSNEELSRQLHNTKHFLRIAKDQIVAYKTLHSRVFDDILKLWKELSPVKPDESTGDKISSESDATHYANTEIEFIRLQIKNLNDKLAEEQEKYRALSAVARSYIDLTTK